MSVNPNYGKEANDLCSDPECPVKRRTSKHCLFHCCEECNIHGHLCGGCGANLNHGEGTCRECSTL